MRYLAEIAWSPDAIVRNRTLEWTGLGERIARQPSFGLRPVLRWTSSSTPTAASTRCRRPTGRGSRTAALWSAPGGAASPTTACTAIDRSFPWRSRLGDRWRLEHRVARPTHWMESFNSRLSCRTRCGRHFLERADVGGDIAGFISAQREVRHLRVRIQQKTRASRR